MKISDLANIVAAPARPVVLWGLRADEDTDSLVPVTLVGIESDFSPYLLPDGTIYAPYEGDSGEHLVFDNPDAWVVYEVAKRTARIAERKAQRAERDSK